MDASRYLAGHRADTDSDVVIGPIRRGVVSDDDAREPWLPSSTHGGGDVAVTSEASAGVHGEAIG